MSSFYVGDDHAFDVVQESVASSRGIKTSTVVSHMCECITAGLPVDIRRLGLNEGVQQLIIDTIRKPPINSGTQKVHCPHDALQDIKYSYCSWKKEQFSQYPSIHTNYIISHCTTLQL